MILVSYIIVRLTFANKYFILGNITISSIIFLLVDESAYDSVILSHHLPGKPRFLGVTARSIQKASFMFMNKSKTEGKSTDTRQLVLVRGIRRQMANKISIIKKQSWQLSRPLRMLDLIWYCLQEALEGHVSTYQHLCLKCTP